MSCENSFRGAWGCRGACRTGQRDREPSRADPGSSDLEAAPGNRQPSQAREAFCPEKPQKRLGRCWLLPSVSLLQLVRVSGMRRARTGPPSPALARKLPCAGAHISKPIRTQDLAMSGVRVCGLMQWVEQHPQIADPLEGLSTTTGLCP